MTSPTSDFPSIFAHTLRKEWGIGVLAWEDGGKRGYLFEDGEERTMASGFHQLMRRVEKPNAEQIAAHERLRQRLAVSEKAASLATAGGPTFLDQMINVVTASTLLCYALYTLAPETVEKFGSTALIYTLPFVLFGIFRYLYLVYQVSNPRNPTEAILRDLPFVLNVGLWSLTVIAVIYLT